MIAGSAGTGRIAERTAGRPHVDTVRTEQVYDKTTTKSATRSHVLIVNAVICVYVRTPSRGSVRVGDPTKQDGVRSYSGPYLTDAGANAYVA